MSEPRFNFHAQTIFLTYPQCTLAKEELLIQLHEKFEIKDYCIALELHSDGHPHLHAFLKLDRKIHKRSPDFADVLGFHPNITAPRSIKAVIKYVQKDGDCLTSDGIKDLLEKKSYGQLIAESTTTVEFLASVEKHYPRDAVLNYEKIKTYAEARFKEPVSVYSSPYRTEDFKNTLDAMDNWTSETLPQPRMNPLVYIVECDA